MPLTPDMRRSIDQIRDYLFGGGYPDPVNNAEQLSFFFFFYLVEGIDAEAVALQAGYESRFVGEWELRNPLNALSFDLQDGGIAARLMQTGSPRIDRSRFRWSAWARQLTGDALVRFVRDEVFPFFAQIGEASPQDFMRGARLDIDDPTVLTQLLKLIDGLELDRADADTKGDLFEHVLRQIKQAGELGQFRTPRHIIRGIVRMIDPQLGETVYDPAAGTAGFLVAAYNHIRLAHSSPQGVSEAETDGKRHQRGNGDRLSADDLRTLQGRTFYGNDVDPKMVRLAAMNLTLRGLSKVPILQRNVLTAALDIERRKALEMPSGGYHVVLANPPFSGRVDKDRIVAELRIGTTSATELLFLRYILASLRPEGRAAVIVPEGVLFGATSAHRELRRQLIDDNRIEAVLSLPSGVFQPYSGVKTSVLIFSRGGSTGHVQFLHVDHDGYRLDANHDTAIDTDDLPAMAAAFARRDAALAEWQARDRNAEWPHKWWFASADDLRGKDFNLSASRYRPLNQSQNEHLDPRELLEELSAIEQQIAMEIDALRQALGEEEGSP
ncbi:Type I restriction enzyme M protein [Burkholderiales bacterium 8X]|nr:Type I restriction enzyme M protein [Burkholderiales bacterium 8X]